MNGVNEKRLSKTIHKQSVDEWRRYLANLAGDDWLMVDSPMFSVFYEDNGDDDADDQFDEDIMFSHESEEEYD